jgi:hypothetical protein
LPNASFVQAAANSNLDCAPLSTIGNCSFAAQEPRRFVVAAFGNAFAATIAR